MLTCCLFGMCRSLDLKTAVGIGNYVGKVYIEYLRSNQDGWNTFATMNHTYHKNVFADYTMFTPVNTPYSIKDPLKWQPLLETNEVGYYTIQTHITPQAGSAKPFALTKAEVQARKLPSPYPYGYNAAAYKAQVDDVLKTSAQLTEFQKMAAEYFDDKLMSFAPISLVLGARYKWSIHAQLAAEANIACVYDATIVAWKEKIAHNAVRPITAVRHLYGSKQQQQSKRITANAGAGLGTKELAADEWLSYLRTMPHADYPSGE